MCKGRYDITKPFQLQLILMHFKDRGPTAQAVGAMEVLLFKSKKLPFKLSLGIVYLTYLLVPSALA
jgi:hypothetical protein